MRILSVSVSLSVASAALLLSACASRPPSAELPASSAPVAVGKSNRFEMIQNGRRMSADDFDRWMKARGIRIAEGPPASTRKPAPKAQPRSAPRPQAKAAPKPAPKGAAATPSAPKRR
jgi:rare lipoprotein A